MMEEVSSANVLAVGTLDGPEELVLEDWTETEVSTEDIEPLSAVDTVRKPEDMVPGD